MKQTENNEIDLLLRGLARSEGARSVLKEKVSQDRAAVVHLDADELSSYAAHALPALTRARYTAHLADCALCRKIVAELSLASGASVFHNVIELEAEATFWQKCRAFFSPSVLRYAVPAVAIFAVLAISLLALREQRQVKLVAHNDPPNSRTPIEENKQDESLMKNERDSAIAAREEPVDESSTVAGRNADQKAKTGDKSDASKAAGSLDSVSETSEKEASTGKAGAAVSQPFFAPEPVAAPPPKPQPAAATEATKSGYIAKHKEEPSERDDIVREQRNEGTRVKDEAEESQAAASRARNIPLTGRSADGPRTLEARRADGAGAKKAEDATETRTVGGIRFRRRGRAWVDIRFDSLRSAITISRGSKEYRALLADEPGIRTIADGLDGEVVLIWKGRAYRIR